MRCLKQVRHQPHTTKGTECNGFDARNKDYSHQHIEAAIQGYSVNHDLDAIYLLRSMMQKRTFAKHRSNWCIVQLSRQMAHQDFLSGNQTLPVKERNLLINLLPIPPSLSQRETSKPPSNHH